MKHLKLLAITMLMACVFGNINATAADKAPLTPEFCEEGIQKAVEVLNDMASQINEIEKPEQVEDLQSILDSIKMRNVRKKYGKIELTDEYRERLLEANLKVGQALSDMIVRLHLPYELQKMLDEGASPEKIKQGLSESKTLREAMQ